MFWREPPFYIPVLAVGTLNVMPFGAFTDERLMGRYGFAPKVSFGLDAEPRNLWSREQ